MDAIRSSRKRNHAMLGTFTRTRSQLFLHRNRSGQARPDPLPTKEHLAAHHSSRSCTKHRSPEDDIVLNKKKKPNREASTGKDENDDEISRVQNLLTKDLRARRVYSPQTSAAASSDLIENTFPKVSGASSDCRDPKIADLGLGLLSSVGNGDKGELGKGFSSEGKGKDELNSVLRLVLNEYRSDGDSDMYVDDVTESLDSGLCCEAQNFEQGNAESLDESRKLQDRKQSDGVSSEKIDDSKEELLVTTLPEAETRGNSEVKGDEGKQVEEVPVKDTSVTGNFVGSAGEGFCPKDSQRKSVPRSRFKYKLFKAPGSVSYRRMFPFLSDIMGDDSGTPKLGHCQKDEKAMDGQEPGLPLSSQRQDSKHELKADSCAIRVISQPGASESDAVVTHINELSYGNGSKLTSSHCLLETPMQLHTKEVTDECLSVPSAKDVGNALHGDDLKKVPKHNNNLDNPEATNHGCSTSEQFCALNEECVLTTPPDADIFDKSVVNVGQVESIALDMYHVKATVSTRSTQENAGEGFCQKTEKRKDSVLKSKSVPRSNLHRKLFKTPGSVSYRRLLPFLLDFANDSDTMKLGHQTRHKKDEADMCAKRFELPLSSQSPETSTDKHKTDSGPMHDTVESTELVNKIILDPANELSHGKQPKSTSSGDLPYLPMPLDEKAVHECLSAPSINEHIEEVVIGSKDKCLSDSKFDSCSVTMDIHHDKNVANALLNDDFKQVQNMGARQHNGETPPEAPNLLYLNCDASNLAFEHHSNIEKGLPLDYDERKQPVSLEKHESVGRYPNMLDAEDNETGGHAICQRDDDMVLNHVSVSNEEPRPPSEKIISKKSDMAGHCGDKGGSVLKCMVDGPKLRSKGSNNKNANCGGEIGSDSESKTTLVLNRCSRMKLLKHAGSFNYKRMLPFLSNTMKDNSCASVNDHSLKLQKCSVQTPLLSMSASDLRATPMSDLNGYVPMEHCRGNTGTRQQTGLHSSDLHNDSSSSISPIPESQSSHDLCKVIQSQEEKVVSNGRCKLESSPDPPISDDRINLPIIPESSVYSEVKGNGSFLISSNGEKVPETYPCCQSLSKPKVLEQLRAPDDGIKRGILKRNPRGCRGLCTCLNCVSFRLHAERAFEFSRNQLLDAEEVAQDLIKELSHLRNILERSTESVNDNPVFEGSQVKEACVKALVTEQLAKDRLCQMNDDIKLHCRISSLQRPRVRFADRVEEKVIQPGE